MMSISTADRDLRSCKAQAIVVGAVADGANVTVADPPPGLEQVHGGRLDEALAAMGATGKPGEMIRLPLLGGLDATTLLVVGLGSGAPTASGLRDAAATAVRALGGSPSVALALPATSTSDVEAMALGAGLGAYSFAAFRAQADEKRPPDEVTLLVDGSEEHDLAHVHVMVEATALARDLVNAPPQALGPAELAQAAQELSEQVGLRCEVLDRRQLEEGGYGGLVGVGQGSDRGPCLVRMDHVHPDATSSVSLVGKGITFDSGGLSLKTGKGMETMKMDMAGAAAVLAAVGAAARMNLPVNVTGWLACAENMPSGGALRPSDVITQYGGTTVEVMNTDAEGRLVLADAIARSSEDRPDILVDVATLTGAVISALGGRTIGVMANDDALRAQVVDVAEAQGELAWPLPLPDHLAEGLASKLADTSNVGEAHGGALSAGLFLRRFVGDGIRWAHLDIAGPAFNSGAAFGCTPAGGTGAATRTLIALLQAVADAPARDATESTA